MRSSHRRKKVDYGVNQMAVRKTGNRKDKNFRKKRAGMGLWALIGTVLILTTGLTGVQADAVYAAQYACGNGEGIDGTLQKKSERPNNGTLKAKGDSRQVDILQAESRRQEGISQNEDGSRQEDTPQNEDGNRQEDTPQDEDDSRQDDISQDENCSSQDDIPQEEEDSPGGDSQQEEGAGDDGSGNDVLQGEEERVDKDEEQKKEEDPDQDGSNLDDATSDSPEDGNLNEQQDETVEEAERDGAEKPQEKEKGKEKPRSRPRRAPSNPSKNEGETKKGVNGGTQTDTGHKTPKVTWGMDTRILKMLRSIGKIQYGQAVIDAGDLRKICVYVTEKKHGLAGVLMGLGTRFRRQAEDEYTFDRNPDTVQENIDLSQIDWQTLLKAAEESQNVPGGLPVLNPQAAMHIEGVEERTDFYETATEDNISRGKAAWAGGRLLLGNGADNDKAYRKGEEDGENGDVPDTFLPVYAAAEEQVEIRHIHIGNEENKDGISGCYKNSHTTRQEKHKCGAELKKTEATFYPNPDEPGGGSWHGGQYTCPSHGGLYENPGTCNHVSTKTVTVWQHEIVCGLEDTVYAELSVRGEDADYSDRAVCLKAVLEEGEGYEHLTWKEGDELIWTDEAGNVLGTGSGVRVYETGIYRCTLNVANADIDRKSADTAVRIAGLAAPGN